MDRSPALGAEGSSAVPPRRPRLPRWLGIVFPALVAVGAGFAAVYSVDRSTLPLALVMATPIGLGLAAGAVTRWSMRDRPMLVRWTVAVAAVTVGLLTVGLLTGGAAGILPWSGGGGVQWIEVAELVAAGAMAALVLVAWRRPAPIGTPAAPSRPHVEPRPSPVAVSPDLPDGLRPSPPLGSWWTRTWGALRGRFQPEPGPRLVGVASVRPSRKRRKRSDIRLTGAEEDRCPYCLTPVIDGDPRGVVICPVCHTPHHADCWAVTGACQVPHAYASPTRAERSSHE
ncbi:MAG TPA: RING finger protein [Anaerolineales bacterium]|nr:RING finger protein [Anaerolineales bacterium]